jgi:hypothetical protein
MRRGFAYLNGEGLVLWQVQADHFALGVECLLRSCQRRLMPQIRGQRKFTSRSMCAITRNGHVADD